MRKVSTLLLSILAISLFVPLGFVQSASAMKHRWHICRYSAHVYLNRTKPGETWFSPDGPILYHKDSRYRSSPPPQYFYEGTLSKLGDVTYEFWIKLVVIDMGTGEGFAIVKWLITVETSEIVGTLEGIAIGKITGVFNCTGISFSTKGTGVLEDVRLYVTFDGWHPYGDLALYEGWDKGIMIYED